MAPPRLLPRRRRRRRRPRPTRQGPCLVAVAALLALLLAATTPVLVCAEDVTATPAPSAATGVAELTAATAPPSLSPEPRSPAPTDGQEEHQVDVAFTYAGTDAETIAAFQTAVTELFMPFGV